MTGKRLLYIALSLCVLMEMVAVIGNSQVAKPKHPTRLSIRALDPVQQAVKGRSHFRSPDGKFVATLKVGDGEQYELRVTPVGQSNDESVKPIASDVTSFQWIGHRNHILVYGTAFLYGSDTLELWNGHAPPLVLDKGFSPANPQDAPECRVEGVTADGKYLLWSRRHRSIRGRSGIEYHRISLIELPAK